MCSQDTCPLHLSCYRFMAWPDEAWQAYAPHYFKTSGSKTSCDAYWPVEPGQRNVRPGAVPGKRRGKRCK